jgi:membrane protease YdiL (CAAX protease family)
MQGVQNQPSFMQRLQTREAPPQWSLLTALFFVIAYTVLLIAGQTFAVTVSGGSFDSLTPLVLALGALLGGLATIAGIVQWARRRAQTAWIDSLHLRQPVQPSVTLVALFGLGAAWAIDLAGVLLRLKGDQVLPPVLDALRAPPGISWVVALLLALVVQPIAEGLVLTGILYPALARDTNSNLIAAALTAVVYTLVSLAVLSAGGGVWYGVVQPFLMALAMSLVRAFARSTQSAIVARAFFGLFFVLAALVSIRA